MSGLALSPIWLVLGTASAEILRQAIDEAYAFLTLQLVALCTSFGLRWRCGEQRKTQESQPDGGVVQHFTDANQSAER
jgi:hypothetical protein